VQKNKYNWPLLFVIGLISILVIARLIGDLSQTEDLSLASLEDSAWVIMGLVFLGVAAIILLNDQKNLIGWVLFGPALASGLDSLGTLLYGSLESFPANVTMGQLFFVWFNGTSWWLLIGPIFLISLIYPDGKLPGRFQKFGIWVLAITFSLFLFFASFSELLENVQNEGQLWPNPIGFIPVEFSEIFFALFSVMLVLTTIICLVSIISRYRKSSGVERAQMKWLFYAMSLFFAVYLVIAVFQDTENELDLILNIAFLIALLLIPISIGIAIMRYRLWDIDLVINRSLVYGLLTAIVAAVWAGSLTVIDQFIVNFVGDNSKAASTVLSTLLAASIVQPARARIEIWMNKRFFPEKKELEDGFIEIEPRYWGNLDKKQIAQLAIERVCEILQAPKGSFLMLGKAGLYKPIASFGITSRKVEEWKPNNIQKKALQEERVAAGEKKSEFNRYIPIYIPRVGPNEVLGLLALSLRKSGRGYSRDELKELTKLGARLGEAIYSLELKANN
jgi:hypothetical protein